MLSGQSCLIGLHHGIKTLENMLFIAQILFSRGPFDSAAKLTSTRKKDGR